MVYHNEVFWAPILYYFYKRLFFHLELNSNITVFVDDSTFCLSDTNISKIKAYPFNVVQIMVYLIILNKISASYSIFKGLNPNFSKSPNPN